MNVDQDNIFRRLGSRKKSLDLNNNSEAHTGQVNNAGVNWEYQESVINRFVTGDLKSQDILKKKDAGLLDYIRVHCKFLKEKLAEKNADIDTLKIQITDNDAVINELIQMYDFHLGKDTDNADWQNNFMDLFNNALEMAAYSKKPFEIIKNSRATINNYSAELTKSIDLLILKHQEGVKIKTNIPDSEKFYELLNGNDLDVEADTTLFTKPLVTYKKMNLVTMLNLIQQELKPANSKELTEWVNMELTRTHNSLIDRVGAHLETVYTTAVETLPEVFVELATIYNSDKNPMPPMTHDNKGYEKTVSETLTELVTDYSEKYFNHVMKKDIARLERFEAQKEIVLKEYSREIKPSPVVLDILKKDYKVEAAHMLSSAEPVIKTITESTGMPFNYGTQFVERIKQLCVINNYQELDYKKA